MKKISTLLVFLISFSLTLSAQTTFMPDSIFEAYCEAHGYGNGIPNDNLISTSNASLVPQLNIDNLGISDLTGIEAFVSLTTLVCTDNNLSSINIATGNTVNQLTYFDCRNNNPDLYCVQVDDTAWANSQATWFTDANTSYSLDCATAFGCFDPIACNYDPNASIDTLVFSGGSSCIYNTSSIDSVDVCDTYTWNGVTYTISGVYTDTLVNASGCDSIAWLNLTIRNSTASYDTIWNVCDLVIWNNLVVDVSGDYIWSIPGGNVAGCDTFAYLHAVVNYSNTGLTTVDVCDLYTWDGVNYTTSGLYTNTYTNVAGCDSVHTLDLTIRNSTTGSSSVFGCDFYIWDGPGHSDTVTTDTVLVRTYTGGNAVGCDSTHTLTIDIEYSTSGSNTITVCDGQLWDGVNYTTSGTYTNTYTNAAGCDSVHTLNLTVNYSNGSTDVHHNVCDSLVWVDGNTYYSDNNTATATYLNVAGCDSTVTLDLTIVNSTSGSFAGTFCDSYTDILGNVYTSTGIHTFIIYGGNAVGCDSTVTLDLTFNYLDTSWNGQADPNFSIQDSACDSYTWNGQTYTSTGVYYWNGNTVNGCDSVAVLDLFVGYRDTGYTFVANACDNYAWIDANGDTILTTLNMTDSIVGFDDGVYGLDGHYLDTVWYTNAVGCDSVAILDVTVSSSVLASQQPIDIFTCEETGWIGPDGNFYDMNGQYSIVIGQTPQGCDSIQQYNLYFTPEKRYDTTVVACDTFTWAVDGNTYTTSGVYTRTWVVIDSIPGFIPGTDTTTVCDSTAYLNLTINYSNGSTDVQTACDIFTWAANGVTYAFSTDTPTVTYTNAAGCDSVVTLDLTIYDSNGGFTDTTVCDGYLWPGSLNDGIDDSIYTIAGTYTNTYTNVDGCDSLHTLTLTIHSSYNDTLTPLVMTACDEYTWPVGLGGTGTTYYVTGLYSSTLTTVEVGNEGCDSTIWLDLTVNSSTSTYQNVTVCNSYTWPVTGVTYIVSGMYIDVNTTSYAGGFTCTNIDTLNLTVNYSNTGSTTVTACDSYLWPGSLANGINDSVYVVSGVYTNTYTNAAGCDSVHLLYLTINNSTTGSSSALACDSYTWDGVTYTSSGTYTNVYTNAAGCDSTHTLTLTIIYTEVTSTADTSCYTYTWNPFNNGVLYTFDTTDYVASYASGNYTSTWVALNSNACGGLDTAYLHLTLYPMVYGSGSADVCDAYTWDNTTHGGNSNTYTVSGVYVDTLVSMHGCDSVATLDLTIRYSTQSIAQVTSCDAYEWPLNGNTYTTSTLDSVVLTNAVGCDSIVWLDLTINYSTTVQIDTIRCDSLRYHYLSPSGGQWLDTLFTQSGSFSHLVGTNAVGCDSIHWLHFTINNSWVGTHTVTECNSYTDVNGVTYTEDTIFTLNLNTAHGCDSIATIDLTINYSDTGSSAITACNSYTWEGQTATTSQILSHTYTNASGCDSTHFLDVTINYSNSSTDMQVHCNSYTWIDGVTYTSSNNTATFLDTNIDGCDSVITLDLTINYSNGSTDTQVHCNSYTWIDGVTYTSSNNTATFIGTNVDGCDSVITLDLTINNSTSGASGVTACDTYTWEGQTVTSSDVLTHIYAGGNAAGCDSTHVLTVTINYSTTGSSSVTACDSYTWDGVTYTTSGVHANVYTNASGCDSTHTLNLTINNSTTSTSTATACDSYTWNGITYTSSGVYPWVGTNAAGCDSTATLNLTINNSETTSSSVTSCDSYTWDGVTYTISGVYANVYTNAAGCDSTHILGLTINYSTTGSSSVTACDSYTWDGVTYTTFGVYTNVYTNAAGCDSTHTLNLTINNSTLGVSDTTSLTCDTFTWEGQTIYTSDTLMHTYVGGAVNGCDSTHTLVVTINNSNTGTSVVTECDSFTWDGVVYNSSGSYSNTYTNTAGCDSVHTLELTIINSTSTYSSQEVCDGEEYTWILNGDSIGTYTNAGVYTNIDTNAAGCLHTDSFELIVNDVPEIQAGQNPNDLTTWIVNFIVPGTSPYTYLWTDTAGLFMSTAPSVSIESNGQYHVTVTDANGCVSNTDVFNVNYNAITNLNISEFSVYPNPTSGYLNIEFTSTKLADYAVKVISYNGAQVYIDELRRFNGDYKNTIDLSSFAKGTYLVEIGYEGHMIYRKIVLQ